jgi:hypothetical protein
MGGAGVSTYGWTTKFTLYRGPVQHRRPHPFERIPQRHSEPPRARARVFKRGETWYFQTTLGTRVVDADNTNHWRTIFDGAFASASAFDHVLRVGHPIKRSYRELVDRAVRP